jgi:endonuclease-3 related protein
MNQGHHIDRGDQPDQARRLLDLFQRLLQEYGPQGWWPGDGPLDVVIGAILTQATAWSNVERAIANLKAVDCWSLAAIQDRPLAELSTLIRPAGYFNAKARKLKAFAEQVYHQHGGELSALLSQDAGKLRVELLSIHGIGPETADDILVYAAERPSFVIDSYTRRILRRLGLAGEDWGDGYDHYQQFFHRHLPPETPLFNEFHALLDRHGKDPCRKVPRCAGCCLRSVCAWGLQQSDATAG